MRPPTVDRPTFYDFDVQLEADGSIKSLEQVGDPPDPAYAAALESVLYRTQFTPGIRKGEAIKGKYRIRITVKPAD